MTTAASTYSVAWPKARVNLIDGGPTVLEQGAIIRAAEADPDHLEDLASFGALTVSEPFEGTTTDGEVAHVVVTKTPERG